MIERQRDDETRRTRRHSPKQLKIKQCTYEQVQFRDSYDSYVGKVWTAVTVP